MIGLVIGLILGALVVSLLWLASWIEAQKKRPGYINKRR